jgi:hypothetical protein
MLRKTLILILMPALLFLVPACTNTQKTPDNADAVEKIVHEPDLDGMARALTQELKKGLVAQKLSRQVMALSALASTIERPLPSDIEGAGKVIEAFFKNQNEAGAIAPEGADKKTIEWQSRIILYPLITFEENAKAGNKKLAFQEKLDKLRDYINKNELMNAELTKEEAEKNMSEFGANWIENFNLSSIKGYQEANRLAKNLFYAGKTELGDKGTAHAYIGNILQLSHWDHEKGTVIEDEERSKASYAAQAFALNIVNYCQKLKSLLPEDQQIAPTLDAEQAIPADPIPGEETEAETATEAENTEETASEDAEKKEPEETNSDKTTEDTEADADE